MRRIHTTNPFPRLLDYRGSGFETAEFFVCLESMAAEPNNRVHVAVTDGDFAYKFD